MRVLYVSEIVGKPGVHCVKAMLSRFRREKNIDFVIANGDAVAGGFGLRKGQFFQLRKAGVDVVTGGDQIFYKIDMVEYIEEAKCILRPLNLLQKTPGRGWRHYTVHNSPDKVRIIVMSLLGQSGFLHTHAENPFACILRTYEHIKDTDIIFVDFHALTTAEKYTMFHCIDGMVTAVIGSGQRIQTADAHVMKKGTAVICDAGRTGSQHSVGGMEALPEIQKYLTRMPIRSVECWDALQLQGVLMEVDIHSKFVNMFEPVRIDCPKPSVESE